MRIKTITIQNFRNIALADLAFDGPRQFFLGANAQGKTNLLEAAACITALRSFRAADDRALIAHGQQEAAIACCVEHEKFGETKIIIRLRASGKEVLCDGERVRKLGDYLGRFPTVVFSSQDILLIRGSPGGRRRWLDLILAETDPAYLRALQEYHRALAERNQLLKNNSGAIAASAASASATAASTNTASASARATAANAAAASAANSSASTPASVNAQLAAFEAPLAAAAAELVARRAAGVLKLGALMTAAYARIHPETETAAFAYAPNIANGATLDATAWAEIFARGRQRDAIMRATLSGPHRDDCEFSIDARPAREFASEGQQRSLAIALRMAEAEYLRAATGVQPVLLADDVLGELDPARCRRFWASIHENENTGDSDRSPAPRQMLATGTTAPDAELGAWQIFQVREGVFSQIQK